MDTQSFLPPWFPAFVAPGADRPRILVSSLERLGFTPKLAEIRGRRHVMVRLNGSAQSHNESRKTVVFIAHHDREAGTEGANDNSAACAILVEFAFRIRNRAGRDTLIVFSDGEEASRGLLHQGAFTLAGGLVKSDMENADCWVLDGIGSGDTVILSKSSLSMFKNPETRDGALFSRVTTLHATTKRILADRFPDSWRELPTPFSDNAGLIAGGMAACALTLLPRDEAIRLARFAEVDPRALTERGYHDLAGDTVVGPFIPGTWKRFHTIKDSTDTLEEPAFTLSLALVEALWSGITD